MRQRAADIWCRILAAIYRVRPGHHERLYRLYVRAVRHANAIYWTEYARLNPSASDDGETVE